MQSTQQTTTQSLQGGAQLQQQDPANQYQQTGGVGQQALGPEQYQKLDSLTVQGTPNSLTTTSLTTGNNSPEVLIAVVLVALIAGIVVLRKYLMQKSPSNIVEAVEHKSEVVQVVAEVEKPSKTKKKKHTKKTTSKVKNPAKKTKKSSKKK